MMKAVYSLVIIAVFALGTCTADEDVTLFAVPGNLEDTNGTSSELDSPFCYICLFVMQKLDFYLQQNSSAEVINATLHALCDLTEGNLRQKCLAAIPGIEAQLESGFDPETVCIKLYLCETTDVAKRNSSLMFKEPEKSGAKQQPRLTQAEAEAMMNLVFSKKFDKLGIKNDATCGLCKVLMAMIDERLYKNKDVLLEYIHSLCHRLPEPTDSHCIQAMDLEFPKLWDTIFKNIVDPTDICKLLSLCPA